MREEGGATAATATAEDEAATLRTAKAKAAAAAPRRDGGSPRLSSSAWITSFPPPLPAHVPPPPPPQEFAEVGSRASGRGRADGSSNDGVLRGGGSGGGAGGKREVRMRARGAEDGRRGQAEVWGRAGERDRGRAHDSHPHTIPAFLPAPGPLTSDQTQLCPPFLPSTQPAAWLAQAPSPPSHLSLLSFHSLPRLASLLTQPIPQVRPSGGGRKIPSRRANGHVLLFDKKTLGEMGKRGRRHIALQVRTFPLSIHLSTSPPLSALHIPPSFSPAKLGCHVAVEGTGRAEAGLSLPSTSLCPLLRPSPFSSPPPFTSNSSLLPHEQGEMRRRVLAGLKELGAMQRRVLAGMKEVGQAMTSRRTKCVVLAPNVEEVRGAGFLDVALKPILSDAAALHAPFPAHTIPTQTHPPLHPLPSPSHDVEALESSPYDLQMGQYAATALAALDDVAACHWLPCR
ncbi:unnamed protein product [Closterium sp. Naga37s-1]|nr:unnamed protein product [Closterium sp. Naga37s-1]